MTAHNICPIHKDLAKTHTAADCKDIKQSGLEYVERRKNWSGSAKQWNSKGKTSKSYEGNVKPPHNRYQKLNNYSSKQHEVNVMVNEALKAAYAGPHTHDEGHSKRSKRGRRKKRAKNETAMMSHLGESIPKKKSISRSVIGKALTSNMKAFHRFKINKQPDSSSSEDDQSSSSEASHDSTES